MIASPIHYTDFYKTGHRQQYPKGTSLVYSNMTARGSRIPDIDWVVMFGLQYFLKEYLGYQFRINFFNRKQSNVIAEYKRRLDTSLGPDAVPMDHMVALHDLGYLPVVIKALPEGSIVPLRVPFLTIENTHPDFFWVTNFLETMMSNILWHPMTSATISSYYRSILDSYAHLTGGNKDFVQWQGHDFSMRGQTSMEASMLSGAGHLLSFTGTDTIPAIDFLETYYHADASKELIGGSVAATEHSVMCFGGEESEYQTYYRLLTEVYPKGIVSIVSDTWDYWNVVTQTLPLLKNVIMSRDGKLVVRPDSGDPVKIICGDYEAPEGSPAHKGTVQLLWETFGGRVNEKGFKELDPHIGVIYGDSITPERALNISHILKSRGFASTNVVYGIGSFTYQYVTRDTFGFAIKATAGIVDGKEIHVFKDPKTDNGVKKSAKGWISVVREDNRLTMIDQLYPSSPEMKDSLLIPVYQDGKLLIEYSLKDIRARLTKESYEY